MLFIENYMLIFMSC